MTRDDIIRMAREAGITQAVSRDPNLGTFALLARFAALIAAPLQERIAALYEQIERTEKMLDDQYKMGMEAEREACARVCEDQASYERADFCAKLIRARGDAK